MDSVEALQPPYQHAGVTDHVTCTGIRLDAELVPCNVFPFLPPSRNHVYNKMPASAARSEDTIPADYPYSWPAGATFSVEEFAAKVFLY